MLQGVAGFHCPHQDSILKNLWHCYALLTSSNTHRYGEAFWYPEDAIPLLNHVSAIEINRSSSIQLGSQRRWYQTPEKQDIIYKYIDGEQNLQVLPEPDLNDAAQGLSMAQLKPNLSQLKGSMSESDLIWINLYTLHVIFLAGDWSGRTICMS